jgi:DHA2 family multidrug resistance protein-like MFS transporter
MLIVARVLLGLAGATLAPSTLSLIRALFVDERQRTFAIGIWAASYSVGAAVGPLLGGFMLEHFWWGSVFLLGVPVMLLLLVIGPRLLPEVKDSDAGPLDLPSAALALTAVLLVIHGIKAVATEGTTLGAVSAVVAGIVLFAIFVRRQASLAHPLVPLRLFRLPAFSASLATTALGFMILFGVYVLIAQYLQLVLGLSPLDAGLWTLPSSGAFVAGSLLAPALATRFRPASVVAGGLVLAAAGLVVVGQVGGLAGVVVGLSLLSLGVCPVPTLATSMIISSAPAEQAGVAAGIAETGSELGGSLGIAVLGSVSAAIYRHALGADAPAAAETLASAVARVSEHGELWVVRARDAFSQAFEVTTSIGAAVLVATAILASILLGRSPESRLSSSNVDAESSRVLDPQKDPSHAMLLASSRDEPGRIPRRTPSRSEFRSE